MKSKKWRWKLSLILISMFFIVNNTYASEKKRCLVKSYSPYIYLENGTIKTQKGHTLIWDDGRKKTFEQKMLSPDLKDTLSLDYPAFKPITPPDFQHDPGRIRSQTLFQEVYGHSKQEIEKNLVHVKWLKHSDIKYVLFNKQNGAAEALEKVIKELAKLPPSYQPYFNQISGTYNYRKIAGTDQLSAHSYGIAIDLNINKGDYWRYNIKNLATKQIDYKNTMPKTIVDIFERHGFIWGGRWYHYDTMHFEYRPEFFCNNNTN